MAVVSVRGLAERACELAQSQVPVDVAVGELVEASARDRFTLSAAYATAVRHAGGQVALAAQLLELAQLEAESSASRSMRDPDRVLGRALALYVRAGAWGALWVAFALALAFVLAREGDAGWGWWVVAGWIVLVGVRVGLVWYANLRASPWGGEDGYHGTGLVPQLARQVAREAVHIATVADHPDATGQLRKVAHGGTDTDLARRRAEHVLREAAWLVASSPIAPPAAARARRLVRATREQTWEA